MCVWFMFAVLVCRMIATRDIGSIRSDKNQNRKKCNNKTEKVIADRLMKCIQKVFKIVEPNKI